VSVLALAMGRSDDAVQRGAYHSRFWNARRQDGTQCGRDTAEWPPHQARAWPI